MSDSISEEKSPGDKTIEFLPSISRESQNGVNVTDNITPEHKTYLIQVHGTFDLDPIPSMDPGDPLNWSPWKKNINLLLVSSLAFMTTFTAAGIIPAFEPLAHDLRVSLQTVSYLTSSQIAMHGIAPIFWKPISNRYGRRPVWLLSALGSLAFNIGCAESQTYRTQMVCRVFTTFFISPAVGIGSAVVTEMFFSRERAFKMGFWTLATTLGPPLGPFLMGFVAYHTGSWRWIYWIMAIINGFQLVLIFFFSPETRYLPGQRDAAGSLPKKKYMLFDKIGPDPIQLSDFSAPMRMLMYRSVFIPTLACSIVFGFASVLMTVEIPQIFGSKFDLNPQQIGLQFLGLIIGSVIGEQVGGPLSDFFMNQRSKKIGRTPPPEYRIWSSYIGFLCAIIGFIIFGVQLQNTPRLHWNVTPLIGVGIAAFGNQVITTSLVTYAVDCHQEYAANIGVFFNFFRSTWGFIGPFWFPNMLDSIGLAGSGGLMAGLTLVVSVIPIIFLQWKGGIIKEEEGAGSGGVVQVNASRV